MHSGGPPSTPGSTQQAGGALSPTPARKSRRFLKAEERRRKILDVARALFKARGYHGTTTRDISRAAGISDGLLYRFYPSKRDLFDAVIDDGLELMEPVLTAATTLEMPQMPLRTLLDVVARTVLAVVGSDREVFRIMVAESALLAGDPRPVTTIEKILGPLVGRLDAMVAAGEVRPVDTRAFVRHFVGGLALYDLYEFVLGGEEFAHIPVDDFVATSVDVALRGLQSREH